MAVGVAIIVVLTALFIIFIGPKVTTVTRKQWTLVMIVLVTMWIPMGAYLIFVVGSAKVVDVHQAVRAGALNLGIGVPLLIFIVRKWILK